MKIYMKNYNIRTGTIEAVKTNNNYSILLDGDNYERPSKGDRTKYGVGSRVTVAIVQGESTVKILGLASFNLAEKRSVSV